MPCESLFRQVGELEDHDTLGDADGPQIAVPALDRVFLGEAVAAEQLDAVEADLHALVGAELLGQSRLAGERQPLLGPRRTAPRDQPQPVEFDGDVGAHERHRLAVCDRLAERLWHLAPSTFSGGEQQRVNIARGFAVDYPILLLDEPTASLDANNSAAVVALIHEAKARGAAIVGIFHDEATRNQVADRLHPMGISA